MYDVLRVGACVSGLLALLSSELPVYGQAFTRVTDPNNPIVTDTGPGQYSGCSWIDFDNDNDLDLYVNHDYLYRNDGNENFVRITTNIGDGQFIDVGNGNSWADYDNDGDLDVFVSSSVSFLYRNDGGGNFTKITDGAIGGGNTNRGWACAWADFDNDGYVDLLITHPCGFVPGGCTTNHLFRNDGPPNFSFTKIDTGVIVTGLNAYTVGTWSDYDQDGDMDLFIGSGPASSTPATDNLYRNMLTETGNAFFERITTSPIATDLVDGQIWNWIDYDNDGDLDAYLTNWGGGGSVRENNLYRNDVDSIVRITTGDIVTDALISLSNVWGDFDNDGDLDCYVANDSNQPDSYYQNNGDGTFTKIDTIAIVSESVTHRGAAAGDYDNDGDLDLFQVGPGNRRRLHRNDTQNGNSWVNIKCVGTTSNKAAIGTKVKAKATIGGSTVWQLREVSSQNSFNGHNMLNLHFGVGDATTIDSLIIIWPRGMTEVFENLAVNSHYIATEGQGIVIVGVDGSDDFLPKEFQLSQNYPNPFNPTTKIRYGLPVSEFVTLRVYDILGREVATIVNGEKEVGNHEVDFDGSRLASTGVYFYRMTAGNFSQTQKLVLLK